MSYTENEKPTGLTAITALASDDVIIVGDTSDTAETVKKITKSDLITDLTTSFAPALGADDNYITDAEKAALHAAVTVADSDDLDFTLTGQQITASIKATAISAKASDTLSGTEELLLNDAGTLKKTTVQDIADLATAGSGINRSVNSISSPTTAGANASTDYIYFITNTTLTLPTAVSNTNRYAVKCISGTCVVDGDGSETIDGTANITIQVEDSVELISDNTEWKIV